MLYDLGIIFLAVYLGVSLTLLLYVATINLVRHRKELKWYVLLLSAPWAILALGINALFLQMIVGTVLFLDPPRWDKGDFLFTDRLKRYREEQRSSWRGKLATWICKEWLNPTDPAKDHC